jgi:DNA excision repair protein ERCC-5
MADEDLEDLEVERLQAELEDERHELHGEMLRAKRNADTVTAEMRADVELLLQAFGIPFVHSPSEAEAQCVFLAEARLVDAVATDDSDALVFGAREVYRHLFSDDHMVECYTAARVEQKLGMGKGDLISLAMLLGCDYTLGVHGVGIVNGLEIIRAFKPCGLLEGSSDAEAWTNEFRSLQVWAENVADHVQDSAGVEPGDRKSVANFKKLHHNFRRQWSFPSKFPDPEVQAAFVHHNVDRSLEPFSWGSVDTDQVVRRLMQATDLDESKVRERLDPALRKYTDALRQPRITEYMVPTGIGDVALVRSNRMRDALRGLRGEASPERSATPPHRKRRRRQTAAAEVAADNGDPTVAEVQHPSSETAHRWKLRPSEDTAIELDLD